MLEDKNYQSLLHYALTLIAKKRYTVVEMQKKMHIFIGKIKDRKANGGEDVDFGSIIDLVTNRLVELKYLDDARYAMDYIADRVKFRPRGLFLLRKELQRKGIQDDLIAMAISSGLNCNEVDEFKMAEQILKKKIRVWNKFEPRKIREKCFAFLSGKGFKPDTIYKVVKECYDPDE